MGYEQSLKTIAERFNCDLDQASPILLDITRWKDLPKLFWKLGARAGVEIGVDRGRYTKVLARTNKKCKIIGVDPWIAYPDYTERPDPADQEHIEESMRLALSRVAPFPNVSIMRKTSLAAAEKFVNNSLDFVFIDGNHSFEYVVADIAAWSKKVKPGGIISGHDYWTSSRHRRYRGGLSKMQEYKLCQVEEAVNGWTRANRIKPWFVTTKDRSPSWFWVKED